jgi:hypothetical protein
MKTKKRIDPIMIKEAINNKQLRVWWTEDPYTHHKKVYLSDVIRNEEPFVQELGDTVFLIETP